mmetsp:Transcript_16200/g.17985  ORF Transcript_16200/g.17985 Transcript_16200/m.17985 type:complete len:109 (+) Transcript_16200:47-373(+)
MTTIFPNIHKSRSSDALDQKRVWTRSILQQHRETSEMAESALKESRSSRRSMERSLSGLHETMDIWGNYNKEYNLAIRKLEKRIDDDLEIQRKIEAKKEAYKAKQVFM